MFCSLLSNASICNAMLHIYNLLLFKVLTKYAHLNKFNHNMTSNSISMVLVASCSSQNNHEEANSVSLLDLNPKVISLQIEYARFNEFNY